MLRLAALLVVLVGCEHLSGIDVPQLPPRDIVQPLPIAVAEPARLPAVAPIQQPEPVVEDWDEPPRPKSVVNLPMPPTDEPVEYKKWFDSLSRDDKRRIRSHCRKHPRDYQFVCGGIGPLHIPYTHYHRIRVHRKTDPKLYFQTEEEWQAALTPAQRRYIERVCVGGEDMPSSDLCGDNTPLVVAFDNEPIAFTAHGTFMFAPGMASATDWPTATTPWIAYDRDGNGSIDSGAELFGSNTVLPSGATAANGFIALAVLDANSDGRIDREDPEFAKLVLWADRDGNQRSTPDELRPLAAAIVSISLANHIELRCDARGNCEGERSTMTWRDANRSLRTGAVVDVYLPRR